MRITSTGRVARRRQAVVRAGLVAMALATGGAGVACIFDEGDYQGGGHLDRGATAQQGTATAPPSDTAPPTSTPSKTTAPPDAGATDS